MNARQRFANRGYVSLFNAVPDEFVDNIRSVARNDGLSWNNGTWDGEAFDTFRTRAVFPDSLSRVITTSFRRHYMTFFPDTSATEWSVLRTAAGSRDSPIRRDFPVVEADIHAADLNAAPGVLLVATQDDTVLEPPGCLPFQRGDYRPEQGGHDALSRRLHILAGGKPDQQLSPPRLPLYSVLSARVRGRRRQSCRGD